MSEEDDSEPQASQPLPKIFWIIVVGALLSMAGGGTLFFMSQAGALAAAGQGPGYADETYEVEQEVGIWRNESWLPGKVIATDARRYRVRYQRSEVFADEWVDPTRLQPASTPAQ